MWTGEMQITDREKSKETTIKTEVAYVPPLALRIDATGPFGVALASVTVQERRFQALAYQSKEFFEGPASGKALIPLLGRPFPIEVLGWVMAEAEVDIPGWSCHKEAENNLKCWNSAEELLTAQKDGPHRRKVSFIGPQFNLIWDLALARTQVQFQPTRFILAPREGYKVRQIQ
ncbi:MAG: hypothetical protein N2578_04345 [Bdellovibrionaceae bacterium]|nr:hypothetical protein [Pseudobdellovibrionaceae bacterium]